MKVRRKTIWLVALAFLVAGSLGLESLQMIAARGGVVAVEMPVDSQLNGDLANSDYADAYRIKMPGEISIENWVLHASNRAIGLEADIDGVEKGKNEFIIKGRAPGLHFLLSYHLETLSDSTYLTMSTVVYYESVVGSIYFTPVKVIHRHGAPFYLYMKARSFSTEG